MSRSRTGRTDGVAMVVLAAAALLCGCAVGEVPSVTGFPPWYPLKDGHGDPVAADFEAHVPCTLDTVADQECQRVKLSVALYRDPQSHAPTSYNMSIIRVGVSDDREVHAGELSIETGTALDPTAIVYLLHRAPANQREYWAVGDDLLLLLDEDRMPRVGDAAYSFTLNRIPLRGG